MPLEDGNCTERRPSSPKSSLRQRTQARRYGFACSNCRRRKAKCDGTLPSCQKCVNAQETCVYDKRPSVAFTVTLQHRLKAYESRFEQLRMVKDQERDALLAQPVTADKPRGGQARVPSPTQAAQDADDSLTIESGAGVAFADECETNGIPEETSIGTDGQLYFYGKTSLYHLEGQGTPQSESRTGVESDTPKSSAYDVHARTGKRDELGAFLSEIAPDMLSELLDTYWCWPHHLHNVLCKKLFLRDLHALGPYISPFLLSSVLTQAARYSPRPDATEIGDYFAKRALELLAKDVDRGSSIPVIQGLLILSSRECACGRTSQGWLYSGMAFRMAADMGMHIAPKKLGPLSSHFSEEDLALRRQIFWSCYTWDKTISLCLGRTPLITETIELPTTDTLIDGKEADDEIWRPTSEPSVLPGGFLRQRSLSSTRFAVYCELSVMVYDILEKLYSRPHRAQRNHMLAYLTQTIDKLDGWRSRLPSELVVQGDSIVNVCPPLHILLLNLLYYMASILLCRPYRTVSDVAKVRCTGAARMTDTLFNLHVRRFGYRCITWLQTYTMFVACIINVCELKDSRGPDGLVSNTVQAQEANARLSFGLEVLRQANTTPSAAKCASIIAQLLQNHLKVTETEARQNMITSRVDSSSSAESKKAEKATREQNSAANLGRTGINTAQESDPITSEPLLEGPPPPSYQNTFPLNNMEVPAISPNMAQTVIDAPFRWLPENVRDDGSWMLMDFDLDSWTIPSGPVYNV